MYDVITIGSATYDVFLHSTSLRLVKTDRLPSGRGECLAFGSKIGIDQMEVSTGGGATNAAASLKQFGMSVAVIARIGNDLYGDYVMDDLQHRRIPTELIVRDPKHLTAHSTILMLGHGDRTVLVYRGAAENLCEQDLHWSKMDSLWLYVTSLHRQLSFHRSLFRRAKQRKQWIMWNPGAVELAQGPKKLRDLLQHADVLSLNEEETRRLTGRLTAGVETLLNALDEMSPGINIMTCAERGAYVSLSGDRFHVASVSKNVVNTTGAGDAFGAGFLAGLMKTDDPRTAARVAALNSAGVVSISGAKAGILSKFPSDQQLQHVKITVLDS